MRRGLTRAALALALATGACAVRRGPSPGSRPEDTAGVEAALRRFLTAFENLDWEKFRASFADEACVFFPSAATPERFCGRDAFEARFRRVFDGIRGEATSGPPYHSLRPEGLRIEALGEAASLASFTLSSEQRGARRRTVVLRRIAGSWRIVHLHASNVPWPDAPGR
jgi:ketosteroid isomerase-like protein